MRLIVYTSKSGLAFLCITLFRRSISLAKDNIRSPNQHCTAVPRENALGCTVWGNYSQTNPWTNCLNFIKAAQDQFWMSPRDARSFDNFQKLKWLPIDEMFKLNKLRLLKKVIDGRAPEYPITRWDSLQFEHKYSAKTKTLYRLPKPRTEAMRRTFFYSAVKN